MKEESSRTRSRAIFFFFIKPFFVSFFLLRGGGNEALDLFLFSFFFHFFFGFPLLDWHRIEFDDVMAPVSKRRLTPSPYKSKDNKQKGEMLRKEKCFFFVNKKKGNNNNSQKKKKLVIRRSDQLIPAAAAAGFCVSDWSPSRPIEVRAFPSDAIVSDRPGLVKKKGSDWVSLFD